MEDADHMKNTPTKKSSEMMFSSEEHARRAAAYARPDPSLSPEEAQWRQMMARAHVVLSRCALKREEAKVPHVVSDPLAPG
jgi:hypothetical protein